MSKRNRSPSPPSSPSASKLRRTSSMSISDAHPILGAIRLKADRRKKCNELISDIVRLLAPPKPRLQRNCNHDIQGPFLDLGVADIDRGGQYRQICKTCHKVTYLTPPIGEIVLSSHEAFSVLKSCKAELATTPRMSQPAPRVSGSNSSQIATPSVSASRVISALDSDPTLASLRRKPVPAPTQQFPAPIPRRCGAILSRESTGGSSSSIPPFSQSTASPSPTTSASSATTSRLTSDTEPARSIPVTLRMYAKDNLPPMESRAFADEGLVLKLGNFTAELRMAGLNLLTSKIEVFFRGNWVAINADSPFPVKKGSVVALRRKGVTRMRNWEIDSMFIQDP